MKSWQKSLYVLRKAIIVFLTNKHFFLQKIEQTFLLSNKVWVRMFFSRNFYCLSIPKWRHMQIFSLWLFKNFGFNSEKIYMKNWNIAQKTFQILGQGARDAAHLASFIISCGRFSTDYFFPWSSLENWTFYEKVFATLDTHYYKFLDLTNFYVYVSFCSILWTFLIIWFWRYRYQTEKNQCRFLLNIDLIKNSNYWPRWKNPIKYQKQATKIMFKVSLNWKPFQKQIIWFLS